MLEEAKRARVALLRVRIPPIREATFPCSRLSLTPSVLPNTALFVYPIKSTYGIEVQSAEVTQYGFKYDREWMLVDAQTNNFLSQRVYPRVRRHLSLSIRLPSSVCIDSSVFLTFCPLQMALIRPSLRVEEGVMEVSAPGKSVLRIPLARSSNKEEECDVTLWGSELGGIDQGKEANMWFSDFLGADVRLVRIPKDHDRVVDQQYSVPSASQFCGYADGFPFLVVNESSLEVVRESTLKECGEDPVSIRRFRANILVSGFSAWEELLFERARVLGTSSLVTLHLTKPCSRCKLTTVVPEKGVFGGEQPLQFVREHRNSIFGMNAVHSPQSIGKTVSVGDGFRVDAFRKKEIQL